MEETQEAKGEEGDEAGDVNSDQAAGACSLHAKKTGNSWAGGWGCGQQRTLNIASDMPTYCKDTTTEP